MGYPNGIIIASEPLFEGNWQAFEANKILQFN
jgi:predicted glutamine amidotransferase